MATGVTSWSTNASLNGSADSNVNLVEGMAPSQVNDSARAVMGSVALYRADTSGRLVTSGSSSAYTITSNQGFASSAALVNVEFTIQFNKPNAGGATLSVDGQTALPLTYDGSTQLSTGVFISNQIYRVTCTSTNAFVVQGLQQALLLNNTDQTLTGGYVSNTFSLGTITSGTVTLDPGQGPMQVLTNNGAFTLAAPSNQGDIQLFIANGATPGTITFSGFTVGAGKTGDALDNTSGHNFFLNIRRMNAISAYFVQALQ